VVQPVSTSIISKAVNPKDDYQRREDTKYSGGVVMSQVVSTIATLQVDELFGRPIDGACFGLISSGMLLFDQLWHGFASI
jgi:hypothetical protein